MDANLLGAALVLVLAGSQIVKPLIDLVRMAVDLPRWGPPSIALLFGILAAFLAMLANGMAITTQTGANAVIAGILIAGGAVLTTTMQRTGDAATEERRIEG